MEFIVVTQNCLAHLVFLIFRAEFDEIGYLTIHESKIEEDGKSQRRGGIHTETPGKIWLESHRDPSLNTVMPEVSSSECYSRLILLYRVSIRMIKQLPVY